MTRLPDTAVIALRAAREQRFRTGALFAAALLATWAVLLCVSAFQAQDTERDRLQERTGLLSSSPSGSDLLALTTTDRWNDDTITVVALEPTGATPVTPPGLTALPGVDRAAVSPALAGLINAHPDLAARYQVESQIRDAGVVHGDELLAYVQVPKGTLSDDGEAIMRADRGRYAGEGPVLRLQGFGTPTSSGDALPVTVGFSEGVVESTHLGTYSAMIAAPAMVLLAITLAVSSQARDRRMALLHYLGVRKRRRVTLVVLESLAPTVPGIVVATLTWTILGRQTWILAGADHGLRPGDAALRAVQLATTGIVALLFTLALSTMIALAHTTAKGARPQSGRRKLSRLAMLPAAGAAGLLLAALTVSGPARNDLAFAGSALAVLAAPLLVPTVLRVAGSWLADRGRPTIWLSGRVMAHDPARSGRPFAGLAALVLLVGASTGFLAVAQYSEDPPGSKAGTQVVGVEWRGGGNDAVARLQARLPNALVARFSTGDHDIVEHSNEGLGQPRSQAEELAPGSVELTVSATCGQLTAVTTGLSCDRSGRLRGEGLRDFRLKLQAVADGQSISAVRLAPIEGAARQPGLLHDSAIVLGQGDVSELDQQVRVAAAGILPVTHFVGLASSTKVPSPLVPWIHSGLIGAAILLGAACLITLRDRFSGIIGQHQALSLLGLGQRNFRRLGYSLFVVPYSVAAVCGMALGTLSCLVFSDKIGVPWTDLAWVAGALVFSGAITGALLPRSITPARGD